MELSATDYLGIVLPALLRRSGLEPPNAEVVVQFVVRDLDRSDWFYVVSDGNVDARPGVSDRVDLTLSMYSRDLADLSAGKLDVARAMRTARLKVFGDEEVLEWFSRRLRV